MSKQAEAWFRAQLAQLAASNMQKARSVPTVQEPLPDAVQWYGGVKSDDELFPPTAQPAQAEVTVPDDMSHAGEIKIKIAPDGDIHITASGKDTWTGNDATVVIELIASGGREGANWHSIFRAAMLTATTQAANELEAAAAQPAPVPDLTHDQWDEWQNKHGLILEREALDELRSMLYTSPPAPAPVQDEACNKPTDAMVEAATNEYDEWSKDNQGTTECIRAMLVKAMKAAPDKGGAACAN
jgi:hypothetical protein